jgi:hypothetical protein
VVDAPVRLLLRLAGAECRDDTCGGRGAGPQQHGAPVVLLFIVLSHVSLAALVPPSRVHFEVLRSFRRPCGVARGDHAGGARVEGAK